MSIDLKSRISSAAEVLDLFFQKAKIDVDSISYLKQILELMGIDETKTGIETLEAESTTFEDFQKIILVKIPLPRLKLAWSILKGVEETKTNVTNVINQSADLSTLIQTIRPIGTWGDLELLEKYGRECSPEIEEELKKRSKSRNCIVFFEDGTVDSEKSLYVLRKARHQETPTTFMFKDEMKQVFKVGEFPLDVLFECPIHRNVLLVDGYCEECGITWNTENMDRLALLRLVKEGTSSDPIVYRTFNFDKLCKEFPKIYIQFKELKSEDKLPSLKRRISKAKDGDPFRVSSHKTF
jgi:hypothetical protein